MLFKDFRAQFIFNEDEYKDTYISLYNSNDKRFYGGFNQDKKLDAYNDYSVIGQPEKLDVNMYKVKLDCDLILGLDSMQYKNRFNSIEIETEEISTKKPALKKK